LTRHDEEALERDAAALERAHEPGGELGRAPVDEGLDAIDLGRGRERVHRILAELRLELVLKLLAQACLEVGAQIGKGVELACRARQLVVERW
jgi:hypothetical protein